MSEFKIEKKVKLPEPRGGRHAKYPWDKMAVGDSFIIEVDRGRMAVSMRNNRRKDIHFIIRTNGDGTARIWRDK